MVFKGTIRHIQSREALPKGVIGAGPNEDPGWRGWFRPSHPGTNVVDGWMDGCRMNGMRCMVTAYLSYQEQYKLPLWFIMLKQRAVNALT
jgi:hypothetical protein